MNTRPLTQQERNRLASGQGVEDLNLTCEGDQGYGPCGTYLDWTDGTCRDGHVIEVQTGRWPELEKKGEGQ